MPLQHLVVRALMKALLAFLPLFIIGCQSLPNVQHSMNAQTPKRDVQIDLTTNTQGLMAAILAEDLSSRNPNNKILIKLGNLPVSGTYSIPKNGRALISIFSSSDTVNISPAAIEIKVDSEAVSQHIESYDSLDAWKREYKDLPQEARVQIAKIVGLIGNAENTPFSSIGLKISEANSELILLKVAHPDAAKIYLGKEIGAQIGYLVSIYFYRNKPSEFDKYLSKMRKSRSITNRIMEL